MREIIELLLFMFVVFCKLFKPGGVKAVMSEMAAMKLQLIVVNRGKKRSPLLRTSDRIIFGFLALFIDKSRHQKLTVILKPATILSFHKALVKRKYSRLF